MKITFLGHATLAIETAGKHLMVDPFIRDNPLAADIDIAELKADHILITHGHGDHVGDVESIGKNTGASLISNYEIVSYYEGKGLSGHGMNLGGKRVFDFGNLKYVNAIHSSVLPDGTYAGNPGGFVIWNDEACIYIAGDTAVTEDMKMIPKTCPKLDLAVLPIGDNFTMGYEDAVIAAEYVQCDRILGYHFGSFPSIEIDTEAAIDIFRKSGKDLILMDIGEVLEL